ncbi:MAG: KilA-N domain-containing protein [Dysgonamonadaceae bacterium]|nr:KilA-N domain-containing protein [Dysgonamonadaceae bacterium]
MSKKQKSQPVMGLQLVKIDHSTFSVEMKNGNMMVNATQMAKQFGKLSANFLRLDETKEYILALSRYKSAVIQNRITGIDSVMGNPITADLVMVKQGGRPEEQGTWMERKLALRFAQWLDPYFAVLVDAHLEEMMFKPTRLRPELAIPDDLPDVPRTHLFAPDLTVIIPLFYLTVIKCLAPDVSDILILRNHSLNM